jgi:Tfp pilus assembly protein PilF
MFYAEAWALTHYITLDRAEKGSMEKYLSLLHKGAEPTYAFEQAFSERIGRAANVIRLKLKRGDWRLLGIPIENLDYDRRKPKVRKPPRDEVALRLGQLQLVNHEAGKAQTLFETALAANDENDRAHAGLGDALKFQMQTDAAGPHFHRAVELGANDPLNHLDLAEYLHERAIAEKRGAKRTHLMADARAAYETAQKLDSTIPETYLMLGRTYLAAGEDASEAISLLERAFEFLPSQDYVVFSLAEAYIATERPREALNVLRHAASTRQNGSLSENLDKAIESIRESRVEAAREYANITDAGTETSAGVGE